MENPELEQLKKAVLKLEEERDALRKQMDTRADKTELQKTIDGITAELKGLRDEMSKLKTPSPVPAGEDYSAGFWS